MSRLVQARTVVPVLAIAAAFAALLPQTNPAAKPYGYDFFTTIATTTVPTIPANQTIYVATTGNDSNNGLTVGSPKLTLTGASGAINAVSNTTSNWLIIVATGTYTGSDATKGHVLPAKAMDDGVGLYINLESGAILQGAVTTSTSSVTYGTGNYRNWFWIGPGKIQTAASTTSSSAVKYEASTNASKIVYEGVTIDATNGTTPKCIFYNAIVAGTYRSATYCGDHAYKRCVLSGSATSSAISNGVGTGVPVGIMFYGCTGTFGTWSPNRFLVSNVWFQSNTWTTTGTSSCYGILVGSDAIGATAPAANLIATNIYIADNSITCPDGHAYLIGDNASNILFERNTWTSGPGSAGANIQGAVFKNCMGINCRNNTCNANTSSGGTNNTGGIYMKASSVFSVTGNNCTSTTNGYAFHVSVDSTRPAFFGYVANNTFFATGGANAKCIALDGAGASNYPIIIDSNTYRYTSSGVLTGSAGIRGTACTTKANLLAAWLTSLDIDEYANDVNSSVVTV